MSLRELDGTQIVTIRLRSEGVLLMIADQAWKQALLRKGKDVADLLEAVLWGKDVDLASLSVAVSPHEDPEMRLRSFLDQIDRAIKAFGTESFGRCEFCGVDLDAVALSEQPWLATCPAHAGRWVS
jgi:RNA polymerase-binding transcription factor DksA